MRVGHPPDEKLVTIRQDIRDVNTSRQNEPDLDTSEATAYLAEMCGSLAVFARRHGLDALGYILDMAQEEAHNGTRPPHAKRGRP